MNYLMNILKNFGINIPEDAYFLEYLKDNKPKNFFYIDQCPFKVGEKHSQIDMFYQEVLDGEVSKRSFLELELKYRNIMTKLWLYNDLFVESNIKDIRITNKHKKIDKQYVKYLQPLIHKFERSDNICVDEKIELELLVQLGIRDIAYTAFYFSDYKLIIVPSWSCFIAYFNDLSKINIVKEIISTEGLYLRDINQ
jgi:hypothetical protein